ncbi:MAG: hypothetical protein M3Z09_18420 [Acidobacteriota bacterium]|nr:hypothetical protein [Acidobacteriota bacterium]
MKKYLQQGLIMMAGIASLPVAVSHANAQLPKPECNQNDPRFVSLRHFFHNAKSPMERLTAVFIQEADAHHLDWRLLPGLSMVESGCGRSYRGNNIFGWNNGNSSFGSIREGIHFVADRLANARSYRGKSVGGKLAAYNPNEGYSRSVQSVMQRISAIEGL